MQYAIVKKGRKGFITPIPTFSLSSHLENKCSYKKQGIEFMRVKAWGIVKLYNIKSGSFPWGMLSDILEVCKSFPENEYKVISTRIESIEPIFDGRVRPYQKDAITALLFNRGGILSMPTGSGKTFTCIQFLEQFKQKALIICPTIYLVEQWKTQVPDYIDVRTYQGLKDYSILDKYKIIVFDECHHVSASTLFKIAMKLNEHIVVGLSATVGEKMREDGEDMKIFAALGKIVYKISLRELINQGFLCDAEIELVKLSQHHSLIYQDYAEIYESYIVNNNERNYEIIKKCLKYKDKKILILVSQIEHGKILNEMLYDEDVIFLCSKSKIKDFNHRIIIATSIMDEGVDLPDREVIIMAAGGKSSIKTVQRMGRVLRIYPDKKHAIIVDFVDRAKYLFGHYKKRMVIYDGVGFKNRQDV